MSTTAHATITFHHADPEREPTILSALRVYGFRFEYIDAVAAPLRVCRAYGVRDTNTLVCDQLGTLMRQLDPSAVFTICQDPNNEFVGEMLTSDPELGDYRCAADEEGSPLVSATQVRRAVAAAQRVVSAGIDTTAAFRELDCLVGGPWQRRITALQSCPECRAQHCAPGDSWSCSRLCCPCRPAREPRAATDRTTAPTDPERSRR